MTTQSIALKGKVKAFALVRDKNGKPRIDDIHDIPGAIWEMLTKVEQQEIRDGRNSSRDNS